MSTADKPKSEPKRWILIISLGPQANYKQTHPELMTKLTSNGFTIETVYRRNELIDLLQGENKGEDEYPPPTATLLTEDRLKYDINNDIWDALMKYVRKGGISISLWNPQSWSEREGDESIFAKAGLPWLIGLRRYTTVQLNSNATWNVLSVLPERFSIYGMSIHNVSMYDRWYNNVDVATHIVNKYDIPGEAKIAMTRIEEGWFGFVGDLALEGYSIMVIVAMCKLSTPGVGLVEGTARTGRYDVLSPYS
ncbi:uncharacterized protein N7503_000739 [Penicillium pulvis]|uniref:uncharacterized protein n=1 Tax=Penicillium pulvis TaxID=1562058 RepID=UPI00254947A6|nr:uncharacterized protein N7503_000739 [Penicillium pulvis]KAJ5813989.1 hypothetical protein N7503_000739 [Penicillium pulvis]